MKTIGKFNEEHSNIAAHRDNHLAQGFRLRAFAVTNLIEFSDPIDQLSNSGAEISCELLKTVVGIFNRIVKKSCSKRR